MKKQMRSLLLICILMLLMLLKIIPLSYATTSEYEKYLALGDSIAYGYGLDNKDTESYSAIVKNNYNIEGSNFKNLGISGMTCEEFYSKIQEGSYTEAIQEADLITISIGSNELLHIVTDAASQLTGVPKTEANFEQKVKQAFANANLVEKATMLKGIYDYFTSNDTKQNIEDSIQKYQEFWKKSVEYIKSKNQDVTIVATQFYNPYYGIKITDTYDLGSFVDQYIQRMNTILETESDSEGKYKIAKIYSLFNTNNPRITNVNISTSELSVDPHPNKQGHEVISAKIIEALSNVPIQHKDISTLTINDISDQIYTGEEIKPEVVIKDGEKILEEGKDYTVTYKDNTEIGQATVTILGIGEYQGEIKKTFKIIEDENKEMDDKEKSIRDDTTTANKSIPFAGYKIIIYSLIVINIIISTIIYKRIKKYRKI